MAFCAFPSKDNDLLDKRKHCFSVQTETGEDLFFSVELDCELLIWEKAFQMATFLEVERIQVCAAASQLSRSLFISCLWYDLSMLDRFPKLTSDLTAHP